METTHQSFRAYIPLIGKTVRLSNVIAIHQPDNPRKVMLSAHWDTRPVADHERDRARARLPILGANDGASGVAVLIELARVFQQHPPPVGVIFAFFDGEDSGQSREWKSYCLGSQYMANHLPAAWQFQKGVNLDMVGDRDLAIPIEGYSWKKARPLVLEVWEPALRLYPETFQSKRSPPIFDDHLPFLERGKPYINVIDFDYPHWHTLDDTEDKCSPESLERVGRVIARFVLSQ
jgi:Zn-dependent M28 family amino/carboxypeptidase